jgi:hypothetical protein
MEEQPAYVIKQAKSRSLIPKIFMLLILGILFYLGILLNLSLLELDVDSQSLIDHISIITVSIIVIIGIIMGILKVRKQHTFYNTHLTIYGKNIPYNTITNTLQKQNLLDKIFKTYSIKLTDKITMRNIPQAVQIQSYLQQMISYNNSLT